VLDRNSVKLVVRAALTAVFWRDMRCSDLHVRYSMPISVVSALRVHLPDPGPIVEITHSCMCVCTMQTNLFHLRIRIHIHIRFRFQLRHHFPHSISFIHPCFISLLLFHFLTEPTGFRPRLRLRPTVSVSDPTW